MTLYDLPLAHIQAAHERIRGHIRHTPLAPLPHLQDDVPPGLRLKLENMQVAGSFKPRGVFNHLLQLSNEGRARGVVAASGGNHGLAVAYAAARLGIPATVFIPATATPDRAARISAWGKVGNVRVVQHGENYDDAQAEADRLAERDGLYVVHPFDADKTLEGQGTLGLEILADAPETDCVLIAIGGGGLIAGAAAALKQVKPGIRVVGVEPTGAPSMKAAVEAGQVVELRVNTIADTLSPRSVSERTRALTAQYVDEIVLVSDGAMIDAMRWLWRATNQLVEPSGAAVLAALFAQPGVLQGAQHPVAVICGGNAAADSIFSDYEAAARRRGSLD